MAMNLYARCIEQLKTPGAEAQFAKLYGRREGMLEAQKARYSALVKKHEELYNAPEGLVLISAPGRTEIGGNHTDHNRGKVLAAAVNLDILAAVTPRKDNQVRFQSEGHHTVDLSLDSLEIVPEEKGTSAALIRGVAAWMNQHGHKVGGFDAVLTSTVATGSGLSSSAAVEVLFCAIFDALYNGGEALDFKQRAIASQYAENVYFGKPCGLMDQMAASSGGLVFIDFKEDDSQVLPLSYDFAEKGYSLVVVNSGGSHDDLTEDYAAVRQEMNQVAGFFGQEVLRRVEPEEFYRRIPEIRRAMGTQADRALLRAGHFFEENRRVELETRALKENDLEAFFSLIRESGRSSFCYLQNIFPDKNREELSLALMLSERALRGAGAWRVHGGGFAGTTLNFVPTEKLESFLKDMRAVFGPRSCDVLDIRPVGPAVLSLE